MKKFLLLVILVTLGLQTGLVAQSYKSCMTYSPERTLSEFKDLVLTSKDPFMRDVLWLEYARLANQILKTSAIEGVNTFIVTPDLVGMQWLMDHTVEYESSYYNQEDYMNGVKVGERLEYHKVAGHKSNWATIKVGDIIPKNGMYAKIACSNSEKPLFELKKNEPKDEVVKTADATKTFVPEETPFVQAKVLEEKKFDPPPSDGLDPADDGLDPADYKVEAEVKSKNPNLPLIIGGSAVGAALLTWGVIELVNYLESFGIPGGTPLIDGNPVLKVKNFQSPYPRAQIITLGIKIGR
jgi:hypothetical protein